MTEGGRISRRAFVLAAGGAGVAAIGAVALVGLTRKGGRPLAGGFVDDGSAAGHALRDRSSVPSVRRSVRVPVVIVGGGIAGLSAAWWLRRNGMHDFALLELATAPGGNSRGGANAVSAFPWGAHYVPLPGPRATWVRLLFEEMGILANGAWSERALCMAPKERIFVHGRWRDGVDDALVAGPADAAEMRRFGEEITALRETGAFTIPMALGAPSASPLDAITADELLRQRGYRSPAVRWLVDYACRDDFGTASRDTSAWAAVHYFASREGDEESGPLTWPEGNARLVQHLAAAVSPRIVTGRAVHRVEPTAGGMRVLAGDGEWLCNRVIWAAPTFVATHVMDDQPPVAFTYSPWLVTNLTLDRWPRDRGSPPAAHGDAPTAAWDNVIADSPSLGYVVATHQSPRVVQERTVWTHYWALAGSDPRAERRQLMAADWRTCAEWVLADLERVHPDIRECVSRIDTLRYGHAMARPLPGFLAARQALWHPVRGARVLYANSDVSGLSLFEEAQHRGITAAEAVLREG